MPNDGFEKVDPNALTASELESPTPPAEASEGEAPKKRGRKPGTTYPRKEKVSIGAARLAAFKEGLSAAAKYPSENERSAYLAGIQFGLDMAENA